MSLIDVKTICRLVMSGKISISKKGISDFDDIMVEHFRAIKKNFDCVPKKKPSGDDRLKKS
jgi:hypothetical protein